MSKLEKGSKTYQVDIFVGSNSFIYREDDPKKVMKFTGLKSLDSESIKRYLYELNDLSKMLKVDPTPVDTIQTDYIERITSRLQIMGAKNNAQILKMLNKLTGANFKRMPVAKDLTQKDAQKLYATLLQSGAKNGKK
jgi:transcription initiation factor TFIIIB Brf1 subunit/transcription initiation factor TFIIB